MQAKIALRAGRALRAFATGVKCFGEIVHTINTFLYVENEKITQDNIFELVQNYFSKDEGVIFSEEEKAFGPGYDLRIQFDGYWMMVSFIDDESINESISHVKSVTSDPLETKLSLFCEVRTFFGPDENSDFDHLTVSMYQFLEELPNSVVYDDNHESIMAKSI